MNITSSELKKLDHMVKEFDQLFIETKNLDSATKLIRIIKNGIEPFLDEPATTPLGEEAQAMLIMLKILDPNEHARKCQFRALTLALILLRLVSVPVDQKKKLALEVLSPSFDFSSCTPSSHFPISCPIPFNEEAN
jgi:hypothetical protein